MNKKIMNALAEQRIRVIHRSAIVKAKRLNEESLYKTFVEPFADVVDAAKLTTQDVLSSTRLALGAMFAFTPKRLKAATEKFKERKAVLNKKWEPIIERNREAGSSGDADLIAWVLTPHRYIATEAALQIWDKTENIYKFLDEAGWRLPLSDLVVDGTAKKEDEKDKDASLMDKLKKLFYKAQGEEQPRESKQSTLPLIVEQQADKPSLQQALEDYLEATGLKSQFEQTGKELIEARMEFLQETVEPALKQLELLSLLSKTTEPEEFIDALKEAQREGIEMSGAGLDQILPQVEDAAKKLSASPEFVQKVAEEQAISADDIPEEKLLSAAEKVVFAQAKQSLEQELAATHDLTSSEPLKEATQSLKEQIREMLAIAAPNEESMKALEEAPEAAELLQGIKAAKQKIESA